MALKNAFLMGNSTERWPDFSKSQPKRYIPHQMIGKPPYILRQNPLFRQYPLDTQNPPSYTRNTKKEVLINSIENHSANQ
jgi:hypothetical protein